MAHGALGLQLRPSCRIAKLVSRTWRWLLRCVPSNYTLTVADPCGDGPGPEQPTVFRMGMAQAGEAASQCPSVYGCVCSLAKVRVAAYVAGEAVPAVFVGAGQWLLHCIPPMCAWKVSGLHIWLRLAAHRLPQMGWAGEHVQLNTRSLQGRMCQRSGLLVGACR
jgi:hypothetical protein